MIYLALSAAAAAALGAASGQTGFPLVCLVVLFLVGAFLALLVLTVLFAAVCALFVDMDAPQKVPSRFYRALVSLVMAMLTTLSRIRLHVTGLEKLPEGCFLLVGNHRSSYDPIVTGWALRRRGLAFLSKPENMRIPVVGQLLHKSCYLAIDRENDRAAMRTILTASDMLARGVTNIGVYPEGTRNPAPELLPFRNGAFKIAQKAHAPIVVAVIRGTDEVRRRFPWRGTDVYLDICRVMDAETARQMKTNEIGDTIRTWINSANS